MPTYDFKCAACQHIFEKRSSISDRHLATLAPCPKCSQGPVERVMIAPSEVVPDGTRIGHGKKIDDGFREVLAKIHERTPGSNLGDMLSRTPNRHRI